MVTDLAHTGPTISQKNYSPTYGTADPVPPDSLWRCLTFHLITCQFFQEISKTREKTLKHIKTSLYQSQPPYCILINIRQVKVVSVPVVARIKPVLCTSIGIGALVEPSARKQTAC